MRTLAGHSDRVEAVALTPDGRYAMSGSKDKTIKVWDWQQGTLAASFAGEGAMMTLTITPHDRTVIAGDEVGRMYFLRLEGAV